MGRQRRSARGVQWVNHYSSAQSILVVGDGDFSFSLALAAVFGSGENLVATSLDSYDALTSKYGKAKSNVTQLERLGATVFHGVDAKMMKRHPCLKMRRFDRIVFNFPHAGFIGHEQDDHMIKAHQLLVRKFFRNASHLIRPDGEIHVSHKTGQPYDRWQIEELASEFSLVISEKVNFWKEDYPGYNQKRGDGEWCDEEFPLRNGYTFKFRVERGEPEEPPSRKFTTSQRESLHRLQESLDDVTKMHQEKEQQLLLSQQQLISISESLRSCVDARITLKSRLEEEQRRSRKFTMAQRETLHSLQESLDVVTKLHEEKKQQLLLFRQELISTSESLCSSEHVRRLRPSSSPPLRPNPRRNPSPGLPHPPAPTCVARRPEPRADPQQSSSSAGMGGRYGLLRDDDAPAGCLPLPIIAAETALAAIDAAIAAAAFVQLARIHRHNQQHGWTRQKIFHLMIGLCNTVFLAYFISTIIATCQRWVCWVHGCGFVLMASPQILLLASFLLLLSFWVDLCHQTNDEDEDDVRSHHEALLDKTKTKPGTRPTDIRRKCFSGIQLGSRQKFVILVLVLSFAVMLTFAILIWLGRGENPIDSSVLKKVYLDVFSVVVLVLGGALACYGALLFSKMSKVRSETVSTEKWKVASLAAVSLICFSSSAILALVTNVPVLLYWYSTDADIINNAVILFLYYLIGSSVPSGFVLWVMRDMPQRPIVERPTQSRVVTLFRDRPPNTQDPQWRAAVTSSNKALKSSPI